MPVAMNYLLSHYTWLELNRNIYVNMKRDTDEF